MTSSENIITGGCQCGGLRYAFPKEATITLYCCHCRECQRQAAGAFGMSLWLRRSAFQVTKGRLANWQRPTDGGNINRASFCPDCGVRIHHDGGPEDSIISLKAGSLDDTTWLRPVGHIWTSRAQAWVPLDPSLLIYDTEPESYDSLTAAYKTAEL